MKILVIEDEIPAQIQLEKLIMTNFPDSEILAKLESVASAVKWLNQNQPDLIFMDVELSDGQCFDIFKQITVKVPVIITTAYNSYAIQAFKVNSIDYLLKPIDNEEFIDAVDKSIRVNQKKRPDYELLEKLLIKSSVKEYKKRFIVKHSDQILILNTEDIAYFYSEEKATFIVNRAGKRFLSDLSLDNLEDQLDPKNFFRLSRGCMANILSVQSVSKHFNSRLKIKLNPPLIESILISRVRVPDFLNWLEGI